MRSSSTVCLQSSQYSALCAENVRPMLMHYIQMNILVSFYLTFLKKYMNYEAIYNVVRGCLLYVSVKTRVKKKFAKKYVSLKSHRLYKSRPQIWLWAFQQSTSRGNSTLQQTNCSGVAYLSGIPDTYSAIAIFINT